MNQIGTTHRVNKQEGLHPRHRHIPLISLMHRFDQGVQRDIIS